MTRHVIMKWPRSRYRVVAAAVTGGVLNVTAAWLFAVLVSPEAVTVTFSCMLWPAGT